MKPDEALKKMPEVQDQIQQATAYNALGWIRGAMLFYVGPAYELAYFVLGVVSGGLDMIQ